MKGGHVTQQRRLHTHNHHWGPLSSASTEQAGSCLASCALKSVQAWEWGGGAAGAQHAADQRPALLQLQQRDQQWGRLHAPQSRTHHKISQAEQRSTTEALPGSTPEAPNASDVPPAQPATCAAARPNRRPHSCGRGLGRKGRPRSAASARRENTPGTHTRHTHHASAQSAHYCLPTALHCRRSRSHRSSSLRAQLGCAEDEVDADGQQHQHQASPGGGDARVVETTRCACVSWCVVAMCHSCCAAVCCALGSHCTATTTYTAHHAMRPLVPSLYESPDSVHRSGV
jgi:hypothetical protein